MISRRAFLGAAGVALLAPRPPRKPKPSPSPAAAPPPGPVYGTVYTATY